jgi:hypothetical protein
MKCQPIKSDRRWTITLEHTGHEKPQFVIRFCDDWVDSRSTYSAAVVRAVGAKSARDGAITIEEIPCKK